MARSRRRKPRRGIILLMVLSLLTIFLLMVVAYVVASGQYGSASRAFARHELTGDQPQQLAERALYQVLRDTVSRSSIRGHSLLGDLYSGRDMVRGIVTGVAQEVGGQFVVIGFAPAAGFSFSSVPDAYNGNVLTILDGPAALRSTRIVDYDPAGGFLRVEMFPADNPINVLPVAGNTFLINGRALNGTGFGYNPATGNVDATFNEIDPATGLPTVPLPVALLPHFGAYMAGVPDQGGADEDYDAVDFQNMILAMVPGTAAGSADIIPSLHRPELVFYWRNQRPDLWDPSINPNYREFRRKIVLRPMPWDHPNFSGGNPAFDGLARTDAQMADSLVIGPWDVDNDRDGFDDSIWIDPGFPVQTSPDGRRYKVLVAILCRDLDGRLNLNAHGSLVHTDHDGDAATDSGYFDPVPGPFAGGVTPIPLPRGHGYGPADIFYGHLTGGEYRQLIAARYGPFVSANVNSQPLGMRGESFLSFIKSQGLPNAYLIANRSRYGSPPDVWGRDAVGLDFAGQPVTAYVGVPPGQRLDDPYEINLFDMGRNDVTGAVNPAHIDRPYTVADLERLLRYFDGDAAAQSQRLMLTAPGTFSAMAQQRNRAAFTTESRHIPTPNVGLFSEWRASLPGTTSVSVAELYSVRLLAGGVPAANLPAELAIVLPFELRRGQLLNVNRTIGNGRDDDGNNVVDEPLEADAGEEVWPPGTPGGYSGIPLNPLNNDPLIGVPRFAPQILARHLYCLASLLVDAGYLQPTVEPGLGPAEQRELTAHRLAQWAVNVVDFRDSDGIMTPFEYDVNPFNGWQPMDGNPVTDEGTERRIVWGCEYPDLLLTEGTSFHDRRAADTDDDNNEMDYRQQGGTSMTMEGDDDLDQFRIPQGSLFLEVYCTRNRGANNPILPIELYDANGMLDLGRVAPVGADGLRHPVWRVLVSGRVADAETPFIRSVAQPDSTSFEPANMSLLTPVTGVPEPLPIERVVWFAPLDPGDPATVPRAAITYFERTGTLNAGGANQPATSNLLLAPGSYAVVMPRPVTHVGSTDDADPNTVNPESPHTIARVGNSLTVVDNDGVNRYPIVGTQIRAPLSLVAAAHPPLAWTNAGATAPLGIGASVSEPLPQSSYYLEPTFSLGVGRPIDAYDDPDPTLRTNQIPDTPFDEDDDPLVADRPLVGDPALRETGTTQNYKSAFLQRLANPLEPFDPLANPYITIDWTGIDLTVFNGEDKKPSTYPMALEPWDPSDPNYDPANPTDPDNKRFATREKGFRRRTDSTPPLYPPIDPPDDRLWTNATTPPVLTATSGPPENFFPFNLVHSLGYLNVTMGVPVAIPPAPPAYLGDPAEPFPWLTWNNRPYDTPLELMLVPATTQARLLHEFSLQTPDDPYDPAGGNPANYRAPFGHLLNFFQTSSPATPEPSPHFYRMFDFVETPSPFVGAEKWYSPAQFAAAPAGSGADGFRPPYNSLSRFRDPGLVNINTVFDEQVWEGVVMGFPTMRPSLGSPTWSKLERSRQGYGAAPGIDSAYPTRFAAPFRSAAGADLAPLANLRQAGVDATLLRRDPDIPSDPLFDFTSAAPYENSQRNPAFRYAGITRLGNLLTTHSNVYAVWITVGFFEVEDNNAGVGLPAVVDAGHPDGLRLGQELGLDSGEVKRHRAFFIIDRSIPVAYEPGQNHNVDQAILLRRFIE